MSPALSTNLATQGPVLPSSTAIAIPPRVAYTVACDCQSGPGAAALSLLLLLAAALRRRTGRR